MTDLQSTATAQPTATAQRTPTQATPTQPTPSVEHDLTARSDLITVPAGLKGVAAVDTAIGDVRGSEGFFHYRGRNAVEVARTRSLETAWHLLLHGNEPTDGDRFRSEVGRARVLSDSVLDRVGPIAGSGLPAHLALQALLPLTARGSESWLDVSPDEHRRRVISAAASVPTLLGAVASAGRKAAITNGDSERSHAADWLRLATGVEPPEARARMVEIYLTSTMDHGLNASTFATRVVTSTGADPVSALVAGVGALSGPLHGGAPKRALSMIEAIGDPANTEAWVQARLDRGAKLMGFGHAVYRADDPRSLLLRDVALEHGGPLVERAVEIERRTLAVLRSWKPDAVIVTNVEFYAGVVLHLAGMPPEQFTPTFMVSRVLGWAAHVIEQAEHNKIIRPSARFVEPDVIEPNVPA